MNARRCALARRGRQQNGRPTLLSRAGRTAPMEWGPSLRLLHRQPHRVPPLGPRSVVVPDLVESQQIGEREPRMRGALADPAVGDRLPIFLEAVVLLVELLELTGRAECVSLRIDRLSPRNALGPGNVPPAEAAFLGILGHVGFLTPVLL